jgi:hypothetical protein
MSSRAGIEALEGGKISSSSRELNLDSSVFEVET